VEGGKASTLNHLIVHTLNSNATHNTLEANKIDSTSKERKQINSSKRGNEKQLPYAFLSKEGDSLSLFVYHV